MSQADDAAEIPDAVVVSPDTDAVHRHGNGVEPACIARLHHVDDADWRLTQERLTDAENRCGHPECFQDERALTDGGVVVPPKYQAEPRQYEDKRYLQEQYWGELKSIQDIADECDTGNKVIRNEMHRHGIPTRVDGYTFSNSVSPFAGFYRGTHDAARTDEQSRTRFDPDFEAGHDSSTDDDGSFEWGVVDSKGDRR